MPVRPASTTLTGVLCLAAAAVAACSGSDATNGGDGGSTGRDGGPRDPGPRAGPFTPPSSLEWHTLAADPQRSSAVTERVTDATELVRYRSLDTYIHYRTQIIAAGNRLFISTTDGLWALDAETLDPAWLYRTEMPLGHSPTYADGYLYVGGFDRRIHAISADTGALKAGWNFVDAGAGFETNPLVIDGMVYAGSRDGYFYALDAETGELRWRYRTDGPIRFSAAFADDVVYFASDDAHAYALTTGGELVWQSALLPGPGFHSYWPVVYGDYVIFQGGKNYRMGEHPPQNPPNEIELFPNRETEAPNTLIDGSGDVDDPIEVIDVSVIVDHLEANPHRRTFFLLDRRTGEEVTFDADGDGIRDYAPISFGSAAKSGGKYPPTISPDGRLVVFETLYSQPWIPRGGFVYWTPGEHTVTRMTRHSFPTDEPAALAWAGDTMHFSQCCDRSGGSTDLTMTFARNTLRRYDYSLRTVAPGYLFNYYGNDRNGWGVYGGLNGVYGKHGVQNPPTPHHGRLYEHKSSTIMVWGSAGDAVQLPALGLEGSPTPAPPLSRAEVQARLEAEIEKMLAAGHLRPGRHPTGIAEFGIYRADDRYGSAGARFNDYFHNPSDTIVTLLNALPHLPPALSDRTRAYIQSEFDANPVHSVTHIGWVEGAPREAFEVPADVLERWGAGGYGGQSTANNFGHMQEHFPPYNAYAAFRYAQEFGNAGPLLARLAERFEPHAPEHEAYLVDHPYVMNAYIAGYYGYLELERLAGMPPSAAMQQRLDALIELRVSRFSKDTVIPLEEIDQGRTGTLYGRVMNVARNFLYLTPETSALLRSGLQPQVTEAVDEYARAAPFWFVSRLDVSTGETVFHHNLDYPAIFQAKAWLLEQPFAELAKYIDVPGFHRGDLYHIQNLIAAIEAHD